MGKKPDKILNMERVFTYVNSNSHIVKEKGNEKRERVCGQPEKTGYESIPVWRTA
jgi:hypothetical protein